MQLSIKGLALALGLAWGGGVALLGLAASLGWGRALVEVLGSVYVGFGPSPLASAIGGLWAFGDGALGGIVIAWLSSSRIAARAERPRHAVGPPTRCRGGGGARGSPALRRRAR